MRIVGTCRAQLGIYCEKHTNFFVILLDLLGFLSAALFSLIFYLFHQNHTNTLFFYYTFCVYSEHSDSLYCDPYFVAAFLFCLGMTVQSPSTFSFLPHGT